MITKIEMNGKKHIAVVLECCNTLEDLNRVQTALIYSIKAIANSRDECGCNNELWELANLLEEMRLTDVQAVRADNAVF